MNLPSAYLDRMKGLLKDSLPDYLESFHAPAVKGFHVNQMLLPASSPLPDIFFQPEEASGLEARELPSVPGGYRCNAEHIGHHPLHHAGLIYSQDPGAMLPATLADIRPGMRILDLCAAPGGKTSQLLSAMKGSGVLIANEPQPERNRILQQNMERMGYPNVMVTCADPSDLAPALPEAFDCILVDAPCSGEGMFRKYPESIAEWSQDNVRHCALRQRDILESAVQMLAPGGQLIYSTCTYAPEENEMQILWLKNKFGLIAGPIPERIQKITVSTMEGTARFYPHLAPGEGQFMASLRKPGETPASAMSFRPLIPSGKQRPEDKVLKALREFPDLWSLLEEQRHRLYTSHGNLWLLPENAPFINDRWLSAPGIALGSTDPRGKRFIPHHHLFKALAGKFSLRLDLTPDSPLVDKYLRGEELDAALLGREISGKGFGVVTLCGASLGGFRYAGGRLKNLYPKGLREQE